MTNIGYNAARLDLSGRFAASTIVVASPAAAAETVVAQLTIPAGVQLMAGVLLQAWLAYTLGASAASAQLRLRRTNLAGAIVADTGAMTGGHNAGGLVVSDDIAAFDASPPTPGTYALTLQVASAAAPSPVSLAVLTALVV